jgi:hypothetical protein
VRVAHRGKLKPPEAPASEKNTWIEVADNDELRSLFSFLAARPVNGHKGDPAGETRTRRRSASEVTDTENLPMLLK